MENSGDTETATLEAQFRRLHDKRDGLYRAIALAIGDVSVAADAVDEAMTRAFSHWDRVSDYDNPEGWVYRVALNWSRSTFRKRRREDLWGEPPDELMFDRLPDLELRRAIGGLPLTYRSVVVARYLLDWSTTDTAEALGIPEATVKSRLRRALARLAKDLEGAAR